MNYISVKEAAAKWGVTIQMVRRYCQKGMIHQVIQVNGGWRIPEGTPRPGTSKPEKVELEQSKLVHQLKGQKEKNYHYGIYEYLQVSFAYSSNRMASNCLINKRHIGINNLFNLSIICYNTTRA